MNNRMNRQKSNRSGYFVGTEATRAYVDRLVRTVVNNLDTSDVGLPCPIGLSVRVRYVAAEGNALSADFTFCHCLHLLSA